MGHIALTVELDQLTIARGTELHNEGSAPPPKDEGKHILIYLT